MKIFYRLVHSLYVRHNQPADCRLIVRHSSLWWTFPRATQQRCLTFALRLCTMAWSSKVSLHTDQTLALLNDATVEIGNKFCLFTKKTCPVFTTWELRCETEARKWRQLKKASGSRVSNVGACSLAPDKAHQKWDNILLKSFNLDIYKYHAPGDYANTIRRCGTTDSYTLEPVSASGDTCHV